MKVGIIGFGRMGSLITHFLAQDFEVWAYDIKGLEKEIKAKGATPKSFEEACKADVIIPFVPISEFEPVIKKMAPALKQGALVIDACSVKEYPVSIMQKHLPKDAFILGSHPMFGPDSAKDTLFGTKVVVCPIRIPDNLYEGIVTYMEDHGIRVLRSTPEHHDKEISSSLVLTHYIGRALVEYQASPLNIDTKGYRRLMKILETVVNDSWQLFQDMNKYNAYAPDARESFRSALLTIEEKLKDES